MANLCISDVTFYNEYENLDKIQKLKQDIDTWFKKCSTIDDNYIGNFFDHIKLPKSNLYLRGAVNEVNIQENSCSLKCESSWQPLWNAYEAISKFYGVNYVFIAEQSGDDIYYNTDNEGIFYNHKYRIIIYNENEKLLKDLIANIGEDTDFDFSSKEEIYKWFQENGNITVSTIEELKELFNMDTLVIKEFVNPYEIF